jgi:hypothetical protein
MFSVSHPLPPRQDIQQVLKSGGLVPVVGLPCLLADGTIHWYNREWEQGFYSFLAAGAEAGWFASEARFARRAAAATEAPSGIKNIIIDTAQLQSKFKHAADFGVVGNANKAMLQAFSDAIQNFVKSPGVQRIVGSYRGKPAVIYVDAKTGLAVITNTAGEFVSGWRLSAQQLWHVLNGGKLGGG